ncbi:MAG: DUF2442 domain-containing protein [Phycisphaerales bacterium]|nr:DUF2442 domain-containing protein [Phycisphaerales bacterium]
MGVRFTRHGKTAYLVVATDDGRFIAARLSMYPSLLAAKPSQRGHWKIIGLGDGITWPDLDLDLSTSGIIEGRPDTSRSPTGSSVASSVARWMFSTGAAPKGKGSRRAPLKKDLPERR